MARFLFTVLPAVGHVNPTISVGHELSRRGHTVAWVGHPGVVDRLLPPEATFIPLDDDISSSVVDAYRARGLLLRGLAAFKFLWEDLFFPLARAMAPGLATVVDDYQPDILVADQQTLAGAIVARQRKVRWATFATTSAALVDNFDAMPKVRDWLYGHMADLQRQHHLEPLGRCDLSPHLVVAFSTPALVGEDLSFPSHFQFVGPSISARPEPTPFPWDALGDRPKVLVSLGTVNGDRGVRFYREAVEALSALPVQAVFAAPPELVGPVPDSMVVQRYVPQLKLLRHLDAVVCHAGHNTTVEALAHGLPLVLAPIKDDQSMVASQVAAAGAGLQVKFGRVRAPHLRDAVDRVLNEDSFRTNAARIRASFETAGGAPRAASLLEELAT